MNITFELNKQESELILEALKGTSMKTMGMNYQTTLFFINLLKEGVVEMTEPQYSFFVNLLLSGVFDWNILTVEHFKKKIVDAIEVAKNKKEEPQIIE
jgi:hypothetical protein